MPQSMGSQSRTRLSDGAELKAMCLIFFFLRLYSVLRCACFLNLFSRVLPSSALVASSSSFGSDSSSPSTLSVRFKNSNICI